MIDSDQAFPCRSCLNSRGGEFECIGDVLDIIKDISCIRNHSPRAFKPYGASSSADGQAICSDYLHEENAWW